MHHLECYFFMSITNVYMAGASTVRLKLSVSLRACVATFVPFLIFSSLLFLFLLFFLYYRKASFCLYGKAFVLKRFCCSLSTWQTAESKFSYCTLGLQWSPPHRWSASGASTWFLKYSAIEGHVFRGRSTKLATLGRINAERKKN